MRYKGNNKKADGKAKHRFCLIPTSLLLRSHFIAVVFLLIIGNDISRGGNNCLHSYRDIYHTMNWRAGQSA